MSEDTTVLKSQASELHPIPVSPEAWSLVRVDLLGPFQITSHGNQYVMTMTCYFSKCVEAFPLPNKPASCVAQAIYAAYCRYGVPNSIITDQGREFVNQVCIYLEINSSYTNKHHRLGNFMPRNFHISIYYTKILVQMNC